MRYSKPVSFLNVDITDGFWAEKQKLNREVTNYSVRDRFEDSGRFEAFNFNWTEGSDFERPHFFWDSDIAKWLEGSCYIYAKNKDPELLAYVDDVIDKIELHQSEDGYFNIYHTVVEPELKFGNRDHHELYCLGHLLEAACAYYQATGSDRFIRILDRYVDLVIRVFVEEKSAAFTTPGHEEIELALVKLYRLTGTKKYLDLASFFINNRGVREEYIPDWCIPKYFQSHLPVREQKTAEGHAVRACYLYSGMADVAVETDDKELLDACHALFEDITERKMYISGGVGSTHRGEAFTVPYDLPNDTAYNETCAAIALAFFADRMKDIELDSKYADVIEREIFNGILSGLSADGKAFFYENPLEINLLDRYKDGSVNDGERLPITQRLELFGCSCCPPNVTRFISSIGGSLYSYNDDSIIIHQFVNSSATIDGADVNVETSYPANGIVCINVTGAKNKKLYVRKPGWCTSYTVSDNCIMKNGYMEFDILSDSFGITINFDMQPVFYYADPRIRADAGKAALMYGPVLYCMEKVDNEYDLFDITVDTSKDITLAEDSFFECNDLVACGYVSADEMISGLYGIRKPAAKKEIEVRFIPYRCFANRGESDMCVWFRYV